MGNWTKDDWSIVGILIIIIWIGIHSVRYLDLLFMVQSIPTLTWDGVATILTGVLALLTIFGVYVWQKGDEKRKAARIILMEIRNAEKTITEIKGCGVITDFSTILPLNSWSKYNHLFVRDLDRNELDLMNVFYNSCFIAEKEVQRHHSYLPIAVEEKAKIAQHKLLELSEKYKNEKNNMSEGSNYSREKKAILLDFFYKESEWFLPHTPKNKVIIYIRDIQHISTSSCGEKLKRIAGVE